MRPGLAPTPTGRWGPTIVYDGNRSRALPFAGNRNGFQNGNDVWQLPLSGSPAWTQQSPGASTIPVRLEQGVVFDTPNDRMIVFSGGAAQPTGR